ncbi:MAG TPA: NAD(P)-dependent oxidoreductase [Solirubrobacterales bacterium]|nr:NAD(P)-dependent oxidoreductase [Solirubrobacterales bacterium]
MTENLRVGFAGLGRMGAPMARNVLGAGFPLSVFNRTAEKAEALAADGASVAATPAELAADADVVVTMVADADAVRELLEGPDGILAGASPGLVLVEMSTIGPLAVRELAALCAERGVEMVDAPVSGSTTVAEAAELAVMAGGAEAAFERARPVLEAMSKVQLHLGPSGAGAAMKLGMNLIVAATTVSVSEALVLAEQAGIEREAAYEVIGSSALASPFVEYKRGAYLDPDGTPTAFALELMAKDLRLARELGERDGVPLPGAAGSAAGIGLGVELIGGGEDLVRVADALRRVAAGNAEREREEQ